MQIAKNTTVLTKKDIKKMQYLALLKSSWIVAIFAIVFVLLAFRVVDGKFVFESVFFVVLGAITLPVYFIIVIILMEKQNKRLPQKTTYTYVITENEISATADDGSNNEAISVKIENITKFQADKKYFTIIADKNISMLMAKSGFEKPEDTQQVENLIKLKAKAFAKKGAKK